MLATLLGAVVCVALPTWPRRVEGWLGAACCVPLRAWGVRDVAVRGPLAFGTAAPAGLARREAESAFAGSEKLAALGLRGELCTVLGREAEGAARLPARLVLERSADELRGAAAFVTHGDNLLGFLCGAEQERADGRAVVELLHALPEQGPVRVPAAVQVADGDGDGTLRFLVEPAGAIDRWPLRCRFLEDPYLASRIRASGPDVRVVALGASAGDAPAGLRIGTLRVWGYRRDAATIPIGLFVEPALDPRAIARVVVWRPAAAAPLDTPPLAADREPVGLLTLPAPPPDDRRWFLHAATTVVLPRGAPLLDGARLVGSVRRAGSGYALATPFGEGAALWSLILLPDDPLAPVQYFSARGVRRTGSVVELRIATGGPLPVAGYLFTGSNGAHCPPGLPIGPARPLPGASDALAVAVPAATGALTVQVARRRPR